MSTVTEDPVWPETPTVKVRMSVQLLKEMANATPSKLPTRIQLVRLGEPDAEGFYEPQLQTVYLPDDMGRA